MKKTWIKNAIAGALAVCTMVSYSGAVSVNNVQAAGTWKSSAGVGSVLLDATYHTMSYEDASTYVYIDLNGGYYKTTNYNVTYTYDMISELVDAEAFNYVYEFISPSNNAYGIRRPGYEIDYILCNETNKKYYAENDGSYRWDIADNTRYTYTVYWKERTSSSSFLDFKIIDGVIKEYWGDDKDVVIPDGVTSISGIFAGNKTIQSVTIPKTVNYIGSNAFYNCDALEEVHFPQKMEECVLGTGVFSDCDALKTITLPEGINEIPEKTFYKCLYLETINLPDSVRSIGESAFAYCQSLISLNLPNITSIPAEMCEWCIQLQNVYIPNTVETLGNHCFSKCYALERLYIPPSVHGCYGEPFYDQNMYFVLEVERDSSASSLFANKGIHIEYVSSENTTEPTVEPTIVPTVEPTIVPTVEPTIVPTIEPTVEPTIVPTVEPTIVPTVEPTIVPTVEPTIVPTVEPTIVPTVEPTIVPTVEPTIVPTVEPTIVPTVEPTIVPTQIPTIIPTLQPSETVTEAPTPTPDITENPIPTVSVPTTTDPAQTATPVELTLNKLTLKLGVNDNYTLTAKTNIDGAAVRFTSSNSSVATVSKKGKVVGKKAGKAIITASLGGVEKSCTVTVLKAPTKSTLKLSATSKTLHKGKSYKLKATLTGNTYCRSITYSSNKKTVATISTTGKITAKKKGTAVITVKTSTGLQKTVKVKVIK